MKTFWSWLTKVLIAIVLIQGWLLYDFYHKNQALLSDNIVLEEKLLASEKALAEANTKIENIEKKSLEGMLKETNKAIVSGWEALLDTVQQELDKAKQAIPSISNKEKTEIPIENQDDTNGILPDTAIPKSDDKEGSSVVKPIAGERT